MSTYVRELEDAAAGLLAVLDTPAFRESEHVPGSLVPPLRGSGPANELRRLLREAYRRRTLTGAWGDVGGDDDMKDGGLGVPGHGYAVDHAEIP